MTTNDEVRQPNRPAGGDSLARYRAHGGGIELFRAYVERRNADKQLNANHKTEVVAAITPEDGRAVPVDVFERALSELTMIQILEELDPVISDLLRFCENQPEGDDQLVNLRSALRIGKHHAPNDSLNTERQWEIEQRWIAAYLRMQETNEYLSFHQIAIQIGDAVGISDRTAKNHWEAKTKREPWQATWAKQIEDRAKQHGALVKQRAEEAKAAKKAPASRPRKSNYRKNNL